MPDNKQARKVISITGDTSGAVCNRCGKTLDQFTGLVSNKNYDGHTMFKAWCRECQQKFFEELESKCGTALAYFYCCIAFNVPFVYQCVKPIEDDTAFKWRVYLDNLYRGGYNESKDDATTFFDGDTDIMKIFGSKVSDGKFEDLVAADRSALTKPGTKAQRKDWGEIDHYTSEEYDELDRLYAIHSEPYAQVDIDQDMDYNLRSICKNLLKADQYRREGKSADYKRMLDSVTVIRKNLQARLSDEAQTKMQLDSLIDAMERAGYAQNGKIVNKETLVEMLSADKPHYDQSLDIIDLAMFSIVNVMRRNAGMSEYAELPQELQLDDRFGELSDEPTSEAVLEKIKAMDLRIPKRGV